MKTYFLSLTVLFAHITFALPGAPLTAMSSALVHNVSFQDDNSTLIDGNVEWAVSNIESQLRHNPSSSMKLENVPAQEIKQHGIGESCNGIWKGERLTMAGTEIQASYYCFRDGKENGPYALFEGGSLREKGSFKEGLHESEVLFTGIPGEKIPNIEGHLVGQQDGYALYNTEEVKCQSARSADITFTGSGDDLTAHLTYRQESSVVDLKVKDAFAYKLKGRNMRMDDKEFGPSFRLFTESFQKRDRLKDESLKIIGSAKWKKSPASDPECDKAGGTWMTTHRTGENDSSVDSYICQQGVTLNGPMKTILSDKSGKEAMRVLAHYKDGILVDFEKTVAGGERPLETKKLVVEDQHGYAVYEVKNNECAMAHRISLRFEKGADGKFIMKRTSQKGNGEVVSEPDIDVSDVIEILKSPSLKDFHPRNATATEQ